MKIYNAKVGLDDSTPGRQTRWVTVGSAFEHTAGTIHVVLDTLPVLPSKWNGTVVLFAREAKADDVG